MRVTLQANALEYAGPLLLGEYARWQEPVDEGVFRAGGGATGRPRV